MADSVGLFLSHPFPSFDDTLWYIHDGIIRLFRKLKNISGQFATSNAGGTKSWFLGEQWTGDAVQLRLWTAPWICFSSMTLEHFRCCISSQAVHSLKPLFCWPSIFGDMIDIYWFLVNMQWKCLHCWANNACFMGSQNHWWCIPYTFCLCSLINKK